MGTSADWWSLWVGLITFALAFVLVFVVLAVARTANTDYIVPQPEPWQDNPWQAWNVYNVVGIPILLTFLAALYLLSLHCMGKFQTTITVDVEDAINDGDAIDDGDAINDGTISAAASSATVTSTTPTTFTDGMKIKKHLAGFAFLCFWATVSLWLGGNKWAATHGLGYAVVAILAGMLLTNIPMTARYLTPWLTEFAAKDGEFFIKASLTLLAVELDVLVQVGGPAMLVAWIGSPLAVVAGFYIGVRYLRCHDALAMLIAVGASWCGASAISAVAPVVGAASEDVALAISVVSFFTIIFTFVQPYVALAMGMPETVAGAWIGGSVDQTGNVIVSAAIVSERATEVAGIVKMVLNAGLGVMASVIACYWNARHGDESSGKKAFRCGALWDKFPKFTLGFIITSAILTGTMQNMRGTPEADALPRAVAAMNRWWFAIAFVGIGLTTNIKKAWEKAWHSGIIQVYLVANTIDIVLALGLAYLAYGVVVD